MTDRTLRAPVWAFFDPVDGAVGKKGEPRAAGRCKLCHHVVLQSGFSTATLLAHIKSQHKEEWPGLHASQILKEKSRAKRDRAADEAGASVGDMPG